MYCGNSFKKRKKCTEERYRTIKYCSQSCATLGIYGTYEERFERTVIRMDSGCWIWQGALNRSGYGRTHWRGKLIGAHVFSYRLHTGDEDFPRGTMICHTCDNPACVNPAHLYKGSGKTNSRDMVARGRHPQCRKVGIEVNTAKLKEEEVLMIRSLWVNDSSYENRKLLAGRFGVSLSNIKNITDGKSWKHLL